MKLINIKSIGTLFISILFTLNAQANLVHKEYSVGKKSVIGAKAVYESRTESTPTKSSLMVEAYVSGQAFNREKELVGILTSATSDYKNKSSVRNEGILQVRLLGKKIHSKKFNWNVELRESAGEWVKEYTLARTGFMVGPVPITLSVGASFELGPHLEANYNAEQRIVQFRAGPKIDTAAVGTARAGIPKVLAVGVRSSTSIYTAALLAELDIFLPENVLTAKLKYSRTGLHGKMEAFVDLLFTKYRKTIWTYGDRTPRERVIWSSSSAVDKTKRKGNARVLPPFANPEHVRTSRSYTSKGMGTRKSNIYLPTAGKIKLSAMASGYRGTKSSSEVKLYNASTRRFLGIARSSFPGSNKNVSISVPAGNYALEFKALDEGHPYSYSSTSAKAYWTWNTKATNQSLRSNELGSNAAVSPSPSGRLLKSGSCSGRSCEGPHRQCYSLNGKFNLSGNYYTCRAK